MEAIKQVVNSNLLGNIISLPASIKNKSIEITIVLKEEDKIIPPLTTQNIDSMLVGSVTKSLIGTLPNTNRTLNDYRAERLLNTPQANL